MKMRSLQRRLLAYVPMEVRYTLLRRSIRIESVPDNLIVKLAESPGELESALRLLHNEYVAEGYMETHPSGMRLTKYHAVPSTSTFIALWDGQVVGTLSVIRDGILGFPSESFLDVSRLRAEGAKIAEPSGLAINRQYRHQNRGIILFSLMKYLVNYCSDYFGLDYWVIAVNPKHLPLYEGILFFQRAPEKPVSKYSYVNGAPAVGLVTSLSGFYQRMLVGYWRAKGHSNLFDFFYRQSPANLLFPDRRYFTISDPFLSPGHVERLFVQNQNAMAQLSLNEISALRALYAPHSLDTILPNRVLSNLHKNQRKERRYEVLCEGLLVGSGHHAELRAVQVAFSGLGARVHASPSLQAGELYVVRIRIGKFEICELRVKVVERTGQNYYGFMILDSSANWTNFILHLESQFSEHEVQPKKVA